MSNPPDLGLGKPHSARMYDYLLGGKTNYRADREAAEHAIASWPPSQIAARANRAFMHRAVHELTRRGFRQFLDIGTGIPTRPNLHDVAQGVAPDTRVVYVDNDPIVLVHARALMEGTPEGRTAYIEADVTEPDTILDAPELAETLDLNQPVVLTMTGILHFLTDQMDAHGIVRQLMSALPAGSALCLTQATADIDPVSMAHIIDSYTRSGIPAQTRSRGETARFFDGMDLIDPGIALAHRWRSQIQVLPGQRMPTIGTASDADVSVWGGAAVKP